MNAGRLAVNRELSSRLGLGTVRVDDPGVIQCAIQVAIHETGSRPQNRGKGGSRIV